jgi:hypothetical protein
MEKPKIESLEDIAPYVNEYLLPEIQQSVEVCTRSYWDDHYNDMWIFGTHLWKNTWNRFKDAVSFEDCPFDNCGNGNEYKLKIGPFVIRHHRIDEESKLPSGARAVKEAAAMQMSLFSEEWGAPVEIDNIVLAIDADTDKGLKEVFIGELTPIEPNSKKYKWTKKVPVYLAEDAEGSTAEIVQISNMPGFKKHAPIEEVPEVAIELDSRAIDKKTSESDPEK